MASAGSHIVAKELSVNTPSGKPKALPEVQNPPIVINISPDGKVQMNSQAYDTPTSKDLPELRAWFKETINKFGDKDPVFIHPDPKTKQERIIDVLNCAAASGVKKLAFN